MFRNFRQARQICRLCVHQNNSKEENSFEKSFSAITFENWTSNSRPFARNYFGRVIRAAFYASKDRFWRKLNLPKNYNFFHRFLALSEKKLSFFTMFLLFWNGCQNGLHRFHGNILKKSVFLRKIFFPIIFDPWVKISPVLQEGLGLVAVNAFYLCTESFWGKWSFFEQFLSTVFEFLPKKKIGRLSTFSGRVS